MIKPNRICSVCRKIKDLSCICPPHEKFEKISKSNYNLYNSRRWRKFAHVLRSKEPLCRLCLKDGRTTGSQVVDHIRPINKGGAIWDDNNLQCICHDCHNKKSGRDARTKQ